MSGLANVSLKQETIFVALRTVLATFGFGTVEASGEFPIIQGQVNRVPEPIEQDFIVMWPIRRERLATNIDTDSDASLVGSITANILTVASASGLIYQGLPVYGTGISDGCRVIAQLSGTPGGIGTYALSGTTDVTSETIYCGSHNATQYLEFVVQCDVHGPSSADNATILSTLFRDQYAVSAFIDAGYAISPLFTDDPRQAPFINAEQQFEERWIVDVHMQVNITIVVTQQFAVELHISTLTPTPVDGLIPVDVIYPAN